jgi:hypothetical protein
MTVMVALVGAGHVKNEILTKDQREIGKRKQSAKRRFLRPTVLRWRPENWERQRGERTKGCVARKKLLLVPSGTIRESMSGSWRKSRKGSSRSGSSDCMGSERLLVLCEVWE